MTRDDWRGAWQSACTSAFFCALVLAWPVGRAIALTHGGF